MSTLDNLKKTAKRWLKAIRSNDAEAIARLRRAYPAVSADPSLRDVQHALAREHSQDSWSSLRASVGRGETFSHQAIQPIEMRQTLQITLHNGVVSTTAKVWQMLSASMDGDLDLIEVLIAEQPEFVTCQYNY